MADLELTRTRDDRRLYTLETVGTLRLEGLFARAATADAGGMRWRFARPRVISQVIEATDVAGAVVGRFEPRAFRRGGTVRWAGREYALRAASNWRDRYALVEGEQELAVFDGKSWGKRPVKVSLDDAAAIEPGLVLFAAYVVRRLAEDAAAAAGGASTAAVS